MLQFQIKQNYFLFPLESWDRKKWFLWGYKNEFEYEYVKEIMEYMTKREYIENLKRWPHPGAYTKIQIPKKSWIIQQIKIILKNRKSNNNDSKYSVASTFQCRVYMKKFYSHNNPNVATIIMLFFLNFHFIF